MREQSNLPTLVGMKLEQRMKWLTATLAGLFFLAGCSGINASHSVSPASFFVPGLLKAEPTKPSLTEPAASSNPEFSFLQR